GQALPGTHADADISVVGPLARGAADLDLALDVMAGPDKIDGVAWKLDLPPCGARSLADLRIAIKLRDPNCDVDAEYADKLQALVDAVAKRGATVKEIEPKLDTVRLHEVYVLLLRAATSVRTSEEDVKRWGQTLTEIDAAKEPYLNLTVRGNKLPHRDWLKLNNERYGLRRAFAAFFADWDILLCPAAASAAWPHDQEGERWQRKIAVNGSKNALYSINSSARASTVAGTSRTSALAVFRLTASSNLVAACTGRSAGFSPLRMRSTYDAARRHRSLPSGP